MLKTNNIKIDRKSRKVLVNVKSGFYPRETIEQTAKKFSDVCELAIKQNDSDIIIALKPKRPVPLDILGYEFMNHVLADLKNEAGLQWP